MLRSLAAQITRDYQGRDLLLVGVLKGAFVMMADLARYIPLPVEVDFMAVASYGAATQTSGVVRILKDLDHDIEGRDVLLVEDIVDSGLTLNYLMKNLRGRRPASPRGLRASPEGRHPASASRREVPGFRDPARVRRRLRPGLRGEVPEPLLHRHAPPRGATATPAEQEPAQRRLPSKGREASAVLSFALVVAVLSLASCGEDASAYEGRAPACTGWCSRARSAPSNRRTRPCPDAPMAERRGPGDRRRSGRRDGPDRRRRAGSTAPARARRLRWSRCCPAGGVRRVRAADVAVTVPPQAFARGRRSWSTPVSADRGDPPRRGPCASIAAGPACAGAHLGP